MERKYAWQDTPPANDGDFYYTGPTPDGTSILAIVQVFTHPVTKQRGACVFLPPGWRGDATERGTMHAADLDQWKGQWSGPEYGLCCITEG